MHRRSHPQSSHSQILFLTNCLFSISYRLPPFKEHPLCIHSIHTAQRIDECEKAFATGRGIHYIVHCHIVHFLQNSSRLCPVFGTFQFAFDFRAGQATYVCLTSSRQDTTHLGGSGIASAWACSGSAQWAFGPRERAAVDCCRFSRIPCARLHKSFAKTISFCKSVISRKACHTAN